MVLFCGRGRWQTFRAAWLYRGDVSNPPHGAILHRYRATGDEQISVVNVNRLPGDGHRVSRQTLASPLWSGREVRVARRERLSPTCQDGGGRSIMDTAGREDNSGVTPNTPFTAIQFFPSPLCTASGPITTHRLPPSPRTPFPAAVALPANNPPMFKSFGRILLETNRRSIRRD